VEVDVIPLEDARGAEILARHPCGIADVDDEPAVRHGHEARVLRLEACFLDHCGAAYGAVGVNTAPSAWNRMWHGSLIRHEFVEPPQTISSWPVHTAVGSARPPRGACGSGVQRLESGSYARPWRAGTTAPGNVCPPQTSSRRPVQTTAAAVRPDPAAATFRWRFVLGL